MMLPKESSLTDNLSLDDLSGALSDKQKEIKSIDILLECSQIDESISQTNSIPDASVLKYLIAFKKKEIEAYDTLLSLDAPKNMEASEEKQADYGSEIENKLMIPLLYYAETAGKSSFSQEHMDQLIKSAAQYLVALSNAQTDTNMALSAAAKQLITFFSGKNKDGAPNASADAISSLKFIEDVLLRGSNTQNQFMLDIVQNPPLNQYGAVDRTALAKRMKVLEKFSNIVDLIVNLKKYSNMKTKAGAIGLMPDPAKGSLLETLMEFNHLRPK